MLHYIYNNMYLKANTSDLYKSGNVLKLNTFWFYSKGHRDRYWTSIMPYLTFLLTIISDRLFASVLFSRLLPG